MIHLHGTGVPTLVIGVAARHIHSHSAILHRDDYERAVRLVTGIVMRLDKETVASLNCLNSCNFLFQSLIYTEGKCPI